MDWMALIPIAIALLLIGFFSGIELVFISANKLSIELRRKQGTYGGKTWSYFLETPARFIITILIITNILVVIYGLLGSAVLNSVWQYLSLDNQYIIIAAETLIATIVLVFFQSVFKSMIQASGNSITSGAFFSFCIKIFYSLFSWLAKYVVSLSEWILKYIFNVKIQNKTQSFSRMDLDHYVQQLNMTDSDENLEMNHEIFENVLSLS